MPFLPINLPPGIYRPGTKYQARGRYYDANLVRWHENAMQAIGGWVALEKTTPAVAQVNIGARCAGMLAWRANDGTAHLVMGTPGTLYHFSGGVLTNITPSGFTAGQADASTARALYGAGAYGAGVYGTGDSAQEALIEAQNWAMDSFGEDLVACAHSDGKLYYWDKSVGGVATTISSAPTGCVGVVVTPERFIVALGAGGDRRKVQWSDQESTTSWTPSETNQAGDFPLTGVGQILAGRRSRNETLIWTDADLFAMRYVGGTLVYSIQQVGSACAAISRRAMAVVDTKAAWMGARSFFTYDGYVSPLPSDVGDYVFSDLNRTQVSKIWADVRSEFGEVTWNYPSAGSTECDRYVTYNYAAGHWLIGTLGRTAGVDRGVFPVPILCDSSGNAWKHESGNSHGGLTPFAESGPVEIGSGDQVMHVTGLIPDEKTLGGVQLSLIAAMHPTATETTYGPYSMANPTSVRITARQVRLKVTQASAGWRMGTPRLEVTPGGRR